MTDFAAYHAGTWRDGEPMRFSNRYLVVSYDTKHRLYEISRKNYSDFIDWVACTWSPDRKPMNDGEESSEYLDRIGVRISELELK